MGQGRCTVQFAMGDQQNMAAQQAAHGRRDSARRETATLAATGHSLELKDAASVVLTYGRRIVKQFIHVIRLHVYMH